MLLLFVGIFLYKMYSKKALQKRRASSKEKNNDVDEGWLKTHRQNMYTQIQSIVKGITPPY